MRRQLDFCAMLFLSSAKIVRFVLAPVLSLWIAGAGCMLGCEGMAAAVAAADPSADASQHANHSQHSRGSIIVASGHACASSEANNTHSCCNKKSAEVQSKSKMTSTDGEVLIPSSSSSSGLMNDCPFAVSRTVVVNKSRNGEVSVAPALAQSIRLPANSPEQKSPLSAQARLPNRGHTYLRCCVFLI
jgi:hypothetical protein